MRFLYTFLYILVISILIFLVGRIYPRKYIYEDRFPFKSFSFEKEGAVYNRLNILKWKTKLPDASMILGRLFPRMIPKKRIEDSRKVPVLIKETCVAEMTHVVAAILGFGCVWLWEGVGGWIMAIAFLLFNLPYVIMQRFNRPRLKRAVEMLNNRK